MEKRTGGGKGRGEERVAGRGGKGGKEILELGERVEEGGRVRVKG